MKFPEQWLREWVDPPLDSTAIAEALTMSGHEVEEIEVEGRGLDGVVAAEVVAVHRHPDADRLSVCEVATGTGRPVRVVCGAPNARQGLKSAFAAAGTTLPNGVKLRRSKIRGVESNGMLCSAAELGLGDEADGILELPGDTPAGRPLTEVLSLPDCVFDLSITPNRGDCLSVRGIARDLAAITGSALTNPAAPAVRPTSDDRHDVVVAHPAACPRFAGRVIRGIDPASKSPLWMTERLRRCGLRAIHPVVDVTNYVMLELGQPLHAYDLGLLCGPIRPRFAEPGERLTLLDGREVELQENTLLITDDSGPIGLAGIMGGLSTAVSDVTVDVFFEAAYWPPDIIAGRAREYALHTDASLRFERGVDPELQALAVERATELLLTIAGGTAGPLVDLQQVEHLPAARSIRLRRERLDGLLGIEVAANEVERILDALQIRAEPIAGGWQAEAPSYRFDLQIEHDLIEEVARIHGYDRIPEKTEIAELPLAPVTERLTGLELVADTLVARDYREVVTYSFVDPEVDRLITGARSALKLSNPISSEMAVMRGSLWSGMLAAAAVNIARQQERVRLFEIGKSFHGSPRDPVERLQIAALAAGPTYDEQWSIKSHPVDFFDIKSDLTALLELGGKAAGCRFAPLEHAALQPGQAAEVVHDDRRIGIIGKLHPVLVRELELKRDVFLFELDAEQALVTAVPKCAPVSRYPSIRRDIAVVVGNEISAAELVAAVSATAPGLIRSVRIFDVYRGPGIEAGLKSVALGLILQETSRTLTDQDADSATDRAVQKLRQQFGAELRD